MDFYSYFKSYEDYFWQWEDDTTVLAIPDGNTIAYKELVLETLEILASQGIPPFGALIFAIIATNPTGKIDIQKIVNVGKAKLEKKVEDRVSEAFTFLTVLTNLPKTYKTGRERILVFQAIFEDCHNNISQKKAQYIISDYKFKKYDSQRLSEKAAFNLANFNKDLQVLSLLQRTYKSPKHIIDKIAGLSTLKESIVLEKDQNIETEDLDLITQLVEHHKTFYIGILIKRIWGGLHIPIHNAQPSQQPLGGVSDLTNKGEFDQLLLSEYANDDLVFLSRLANNEALYMQREAPSTDTDQHRVILIDISLKNWGTPKIVAFATMLAIIKHPKAVIDCEVFAIGETYHPVKTDTIDSIIEGLQLLDGSLDAANGLIEFFKENPTYKKQEVFVITEASTLKYSVMLKVVNEYQSIINYWIHTDAKGNIDVYRKQKNSKKHIQHLQLPLQQLWEKEKKETPVYKNELIITNYPILFRNSQNAKKFLVAENGEVFVITGDRLLLRFFDKSMRAHEKGWEVVYENLPVIAGEFEIGVLPNGMYVLLMFNPQNREITILNINTGQEKRIDFKEWKSTTWCNFLFKDQKFNHRNMTGSWSIDIDGNIEKNIDVVIPELYGRRGAELAELKKTHSYAPSFFKNAKSIFINEDNKLVFNIHQLYLNRGNHIKMDSTTALQRKITAKQIDVGRYVFNDQSEVEIKKSGMMILHSSSDTIPDIYIPSLINASLGVATESKFAGNEYYYKTSQHKIVLKDPGTNRLAVVKMIKEYDVIGLREAKYMVDNASGTFKNSYTKEKAEEAKVAFENIGAEIELIVSSQSDQEIERISTTEFFNIYIDAFVQNIVAHEI
ncbi:MAG: ribosomal protein L7/L12 [Algibacter sp.]